MQPNFTRRNLLSFCPRTVILLFVLTVFSQFAVAQKTLAPAKSAAAETLRHQKELIMRGSVQAPSAGLAPILPGFNDQTNPGIEAVSPLSRAFVYRATSATAAQLAKHPLNSVASITNVGPSQTVGFLGASAWLPTTNTMYVVQQTSPFPLFTVDTITGTRTFLVNCTGLPLTGGFTGLTYDATTGTWYGSCVNPTLTQSQLFTVNITTGVCTPIGSPTTVCPGAITLNAANDGTLYSVDLVTDNLFRWNKATGVPTAVGPLGINANFGQDAHFDPSDGQLLWAAFNATTFTAQLRNINLATGASTLEGTYGAGQIATIAIYPGIPPPPCAGTPVPGNTLSTANPACPNASFFLSTQTPAASGLIFTWQSAPSAAGPWTTFGGTGSTQIASQTAATFYRAIVACGANTAISTPLQVTMNNFNNCYCLPTYGSGCAFGDNIARVRLETLNNASGCGGQFTYFSAVPAPTIFPGISHTVSVTVGPDTFGQWVGVWIDYNQDGIFATTEFLAAPVNAGANGTANISFTVPANATLGTTRMRVRAGDDVAMTATQSCGASNSAFGEAEDYNVNIQPCVQGVFTSQPASPTIQCSNNTSFSFTATGSALVYSWEYRVNASSPWLTVTNTGVYSGANTNTLTLLNVPQTMNGYQFRGLMVGPCTAVDFTNIATLTVNPLVATVSPTSATICLGSIQALTLTNPTSTPIYSAPSGLPAPIPDASLAGTNSTINVSNVPPGAVVTSINVTFSVPAHTWPGDLVAVLRAPNNNILNLDYGINGTGAGPGAGMVNTTISSIGTNFLSTATAPYTGTFRADARLVPEAGLGGAPVGPTGFQSPLVNSFAGLTSILNGNWTFAIYDAFGGDVGTLTAWSIVINYVAPPAQGVWSQVSPATPPNTMFSDALATVPYVAGTPANMIWVRPTVNSVYSVVYSTTTPCVSAPTLIPVNVVTPVNTVVNPVNRSGCVGGSATFTASASGGPLTYQWQVSIDNGLTYTNIAGATSTTLTLTGLTPLMNNNLYRLAITAAPCAGTTNTTGARLTVNALPTITISAPDLLLTPGQNTTITGTSNPAAAVNGYVWRRNGSVIGGNGNTRFVTIDSLGTYVATVTDVNGCVGVSNSLTIGGEASDRLWIYPNPTDGVFQVRLFYGGAITEKRVVSVYTSAGQLVQEKQFTLDNITSPYLQMDFDLSTLAGGTYVVKVHNTTTGKIVSGLVVIQ